MNNYYVYVHTNKINGKKYVGQTCKKYPNQRWRNGEGYKSSPHFYSAIQKYGWDNFEHEIIFKDLDLSQANEKEKELIAKYDTMNTDKGYNTRSGGMNGKHTEESKLKISQSRLGEKHHFYGKHLSEEHKEKLRQANIGRQHSDESKKKMSETRTGKYVGKNNKLYGKKRPAEVVEKIRQSNLGKKRSAEYCEAMSKARKGIKPPEWQLEIAHNAWRGSHHSEETKIKLGTPVLQYDENGNFIKRYEYIAKANKELGIKKGHISECCRGKRKTANGFIWKFDESKGD